MAVNMVIAPTGLTYSRNTKAPLIDKVIWESLAEAQAYINNPDQTAYVGMTLAVVNDSDSKKKGLYFVESIAEVAGEVGSLKKVGSNETLTAATYAAAVELAKTASVGSLIKVEASTGSTEGGDFRAAGFYIVSVAGETPTILFLSTSAGDDMDLDQVIAALTDVQAAVALKADASALDQKVDTDDFEAHKNTAAATYATKEALKNADDALKAADETLAGRVKAIEDLDIDATYATKEALKNADDALKAADETLAGDIALKANQSDLESLAGVVGDADAKSGIFGLIEALETEISSIPKFEIEVVEVLPETGEDATVYLVKDKDSAGDLYTEYIYVKGAWEDLGKQTVDLSAYSTTAEMNAAIAKALETYVTSEGLTQTLASYVTGEALGTALDLKADKSQLKDWVESSVFNKFQSDNQDALDLKADKSDLKNWVESDVFEQFQSDNKDALDLKADKADLKNWVESDVFEQFKNDNTAELAKKADADALNAYVLTTAFNEFKTANDGVLAGKVNTADFEAYKGVMDGKLGEKADASKLSDYVLTTTFNEFKTANDGVLATKADATALADYIAKSAIEGSEGINGSESLFFTEDGILEVNTISSTEIDTICSLS